MCGIGFSGLGIFSLQWPHPTFKSAANLFNPIVVLYDFLDHHGDRSVVVKQEIKLEGGGRACPHLFFLCGVCSTWILELMISGVKPFDLDVT